MVERLMRAHIFQLRVEKDIHKLEASKRLATLPLT